MLRRIIVVVAMFMALGVLGLLLMKTQSQPLDLQRHNERLSQLERVLELESALDLEIARARLALDAEPPALEQTQERLVEARQKMRASWLPNDRLPTEIDVAAREYFKHASNKADVYKRYHESLQSFIAGYRQLRTQVDPLLAQLTSSERAALRRGVMNLLSEMASYSIQANPANGPTIAELQATIGNEARKFSDMPLQRGIDRFLAGVDSTRAAKDGLRGVTEELNAIPAIPKLQQARRVYLAHFAAAESSIDRYRLALAIYATALLAVFGLGGIRLRRSYAELDKANAGLEQLVEVRTQELRKALVEVRSQQAQLVQSEKMASLGQLVAGVAHEINTPLGYSRSNVETVRESLTELSKLLETYEAALPQQQLSAEQLEALKQAKRRWDPVEGPEEFKLLLADAEHGLLQISELVIGLKDFSRVDRSHTEMFDINGGLETALKICQSQTKGRIDIHREFGELPLVACAPSQLNQVFLNLLTNAAQAIDGPGWIKLRTRDLGGRVEISITDSGCGMDEETQAHIFEPFFTTKDVGQGTGLGLSIVFRILEDHQGTIEVKSVVGQGTEFTIVLPTKSTVRAQAAVAAEA